MTLRWTVLLCVGLIGVVILLISATSEPSGRPAERDIATVAAVDDSVVVLQREVAFLKQRMMRSREMSTSTKVTQDPNTTVESRDMDTVRQPVKTLELRQVAAMLEAHFTGDSADPAWSYTLRRELSDAVDLRQMRTTLSAVECATSLCKIILVHENLKAQTEFAPTIASVPALSSGVFYTYLNNENPPRTVLYVMREGHDIGEILAGQ
jgi:hypothetical protein